MTILCVHLCHVVMFWSTNCWSEMNNHCGQNHSYCTDYSYVWCYNNSEYNRLTRGMVHDDYEFLCEFHLVHTAHVTSHALIWRTRNACTLSSDMVEQGSIHTCWTASHWIRVCIHTLMHWTVESVVLSHQYSRVQEVGHVVCPAIIMDVPQVEA